MKVYVVMGIDVNDVTFIDRVFLHKEDADNYVREANMQDRALVFYTREQTLWGYCEQPAAVK